MKDWLSQLGLREKQFLIMGGFFLILFLFYEIFFAAVSNKNTELREEITANKNLLLWMQATDQQIQALQNQQHKNHSEKSSATLLSILQKQINQSSFAKNLSQLNQRENNAVQVNFQKVNFDELMKWLIALSQKQHLTILQMTASASGTAGIVDCGVLISG